MNDTAYNKLDTALRQAIKLGLVALPMILATSANAATNNEKAVLIDSVHQWGAWGLDIEPAAGGITPSATQALHARSSKLRLRTNSISALSPSAPQADIIVVSAPRTPTPAPVVPVTPPTTPTTPAVGGPADGLF